MDNVIYPRALEIKQLKEELNHLEQAEAAYEEKYYETMSWLKNIRRKKSELIDTIVGLDPASNNRKMTFGDDFIF